MVTLYIAFLSLPSSKKLKPRAHGGRGRDETYRHRVLCGGASCLAPGRPAGLPGRAALGAPALPLRDRACAAAPLPRIPLGPGGSGARSPPVPAPAAPTATSARRSAASCSPLLGPCKPTCPPAHRPPAHPARHPVAQLDFLALALGQLHGRRGSEKRRQGMRTRLPD